MSEKNYSLNPDVCVDVTDNRLTVQYTDTRPEVIELFVGLTGEQRRALGLMIWNSGLYGMMNTHAHAQAARIENSLNNFREHFDRDLDGYFAPQTGQFPRALNELFNDDGTLSLFLKKHFRDLAETIGADLDPRFPESAVGLFLTKINTMLTEHWEKFTQKMTEQQVTRSFAKKTPAGGLTFQDQVREHVKAAIGDGLGNTLSFEDVSTRPGRLPRCRVGDLLMRYSERTALAGNAVGVEAKQDSSYTEAMALKELDLLRQNHDTAAEVFVMARSHARPDFPTFRCYGRQILVQWDETDPTDSCLFSAIAIALGSVRPTKPGGEEGKIKRLADAAHRLKAEQERCARVKRSLELAITHSRDALKEVDTGATQIEGLTQDLWNALAALNLDLGDEALRRDPIDLPVNPK
jgi:hypothetical protein